MKNNLRAKLVKSIGEGTLLEHLQEVGYIKTDYLTDFEVENLDELIIVLGEDYNLQCRVSVGSRGHVLENKR